MMPPDSANSWKRSSNPDPEKNTMRASSRPPMALRRAVNVLYSEKPTGLLVNLHSHTNILEDRSSLMTLATMSMSTSSPSILPHHLPMSFTG